MAIALLANPAPTTGIVAVATRRSASPSRAPRWTGTTDASLSALVVNDGSTDLTLMPTFASGTYAYDASVANAVAEVTVTPTENNTGATIEYLDGSDMTLADADTSDTVQQVELAEGANVIKVKVTAADGTTTQTYTVTVNRTATAPTIGSVAVTSTPMLESDTYGAGETIEISVTFDKAVNATAATDFVLSVGGRKRAPLLSGSGTAALVFGYTVQAVDSDDDGIWIGDQTRTLVGNRNGDAQNGAITSVATGVAADLTHSALGQQSDHKVAGSRSIVEVAVSSTPVLETDTYGAGETIRFTVTFTAAVDVTGDPVLTFSLGNSGAPRQTDAAYESGSGTAELVFGYTVVSTDMDDNGIFLHDGTDLENPDGPVRLDTDDSIKFTGTTTDVPLAWPSGRGTQSDHKVDGSRTAGPAAPTGFTAAVGNAQVALAWDAPASDSGVTRHEFRYKTTGNYPMTWTEIANSAPDEANEDAFTVTMLTNEVAHTFELRAVSALGNGGVAVAGPVTPTPGICDRTQQVHEHIVYYATGVDNCAAVTVADLAGLTTLDMTNGNITSLKSGDFAGLTNLDYLFLGLNSFTTLPPDVFSGLTALEALSLSNNALSSLPAGVFTGLTALTDVNLGSNALSSLDAGVFTGLAALIWLTVSI